MEKVSEERASMERIVLASRGVVGKYKRGVGIEEGG